MSSTILHTLWQCLWGMKDVLLGDFLTFDENLEMYLIFEAFIYQKNVFCNVVYSKERATFTDTQMYTQDFCFLICFMFSGLSLVLNKEGL